MKVVFFGTPEFAVPSLEALARSPKHSVVLAVTRPDRPAGRGRRPAAPPVAEAAARLGIPAAQPERLRGNAELLGELSRLSPDAIVVVAYGRILPRELLDLPCRGAVNLHASLLPRHRGASPVAAAIAAGDRETGVSIMRMTEALDEGPVYAQERIEIAPSDTAGSLSEKLARIGARLLAETLSRIEREDPSPLPQRGEATFCRPLRKEEGRIDWRLPAGTICRRIRAHTPWPGAFTFLSGERVRILEANEAPGDVSAAPGTWLEAPGAPPRIASGEGTAVAPRLLQREGRQAVSPEEFRRGRREETLRFE